MSTPEKDSGPTHSFGVYGFALVVFLGLTAVFAIAAVTSPNGLWLLVPAVVLAINIPHLVVRTYQTWPWRRRPHSLA